MVQYAVGLQMNRTEMFLKKAIFSQYFTVVEHFVLQFVKINIKLTLASLQLVFFKFL